MPHVLDYIFQQVLNIIQLSAFYIPLAVAFALIQAISKRVFLSFGDVAMFGSFASVYMCLLSLLHGYADIEAGLFALVFGLGGAAALGQVSARYVFQPMLTKSSQAYIISSLGFSIVVQEVMRLQSGAKDIWIPPLFQGQKLIFKSGDYPLQLPTTTGLAIGVSLISLLGAVLIMKFTSFGRNWRACSQELRLAKLCGVDTEKIVRQTFMLGSALAAVSGWMIAVSYGGTSFSSGLMLGFKAMFAAVVGGFSSVRGAATGAAALASLEVLWSSLFSTAYRDVGVLAVIVFVLLLRPEGLWGQNTLRESETI